MDVFADKRLLVGELPQGGPSVSRPEVRGTRCYTAGLSGCNQMFKPTNAALYPKRRKGSNTCPQKRLCAKSNNLILPPPSLKSSRCGGASGSK
jgi:hypothetical protein